MKYSYVRDRLLRDNSLFEEIQPFEASNDRVRHIRRHVLPAQFDPNPIQPDRVRLGVQLGFDLLKSWDEDSRTIASVHVSEPFLIVDTEWLSGKPNAAPPEVYLCLAKDESSFKPLLHDEAVPREFDAGALDIGEHMARTIMRYLADEVERDRGTWLFTVNRGVERVELR